MLLIGVVEFADYLKIITTVGASTQLGDMAVPKFAKDMIPYEHKLILGNKHDVSWHPNCIGEVWIEPDLIIAHDCPAIAVPNLGGDPDAHEWRLQEIFDAAKPRVWVFSHWNVSLNFELEGCRFISLARGEYYDYSTGSNGYFSR